MAQEDGDQDYSMGEGGVAIWNEWRRKRKNKDKKKKKKLDCIQPRGQPDNSSLNNKFHGVRVSFSSLSFSLLRPSHTLTFTENQETNKGGGRIIARLRIQDHRLQRL